MKLKQLKYLVLFFPLILTSCDFIKVKDNSVITPNHPISIDTKLIADSMGDVSKDDAKFLYMQFAGIANFMTHTDKISDTAALIKLIDDVQSNYRYTKEKYKNYTDTVETFLLKRGYKDIKNIVPIVNDNTKEIQRLQVINDIQILADAAKIAMEKSDG